MSPYPASCIVSSCGCALTHNYPPQPIIATALDAHAINGSYNTATSIHHVSKRPHFTSEQCCSQVPQRTQTSAPMSATAPST